MRLPLLVAVAVFAGGCGTGATLPAPGAQGPVVLHRWDGHPDHPTVVVADGIRARDRGFRDLDLERVRARMPLHGPGGPRGWLAVEAPAGHLAAEGRERVGNLMLTGPIRIHGSIDGQPFVGRAATASLLARDGVAVFHNLDLVDAGLRTRMPEAHLGRDLHWTAPARDGQRMIQRGGALPDDLRTAFAALPAGYVPPDPSAGPAP
ncbi:MAG: hypothetical protein RLZZ127_3089 [Planctomycetota bacterium]|jgi:hypothetical protein